jgi:hypothetical protein
VAERRGRIAEQQRMAAEIGLAVGPVGERDLDLDEDVAGAGRRLGHVLDAEISGPVPAQRPHGVKTTLNASRRR